MMTYIAINNTGRFYRTDAFNAKDAWVELAKQITIDGLNAYKFMLLQEVNESDYR